MKPVDSDEMLIEKLDQAAALLAQAKYILKSFELSNKVGEALEDVQDLKAFLETKRYMENKKKADEGK